MPDDELISCSKTQSVGYSFRTTSYDHFQLIVVLGGSLQMSVCDEVRTLERGQAASLTPGSSFVLSCPRRPYRGVGVNLPAAESPWAAGPARAIRLDDVALRLAGILAGILDAPGPGGAPLLNHLGLALCHATLRPTGPAAAPDPLVAEAQLRILARLGSAEPLAEILAGIGASYRQLARRFRAITGAAPKAWQLAQRLHAAERLLGETGLSVTAIALELGFPSSQHFAAVFRRHRDRSPSAYRQARQRVALP